MSLTKHLNEIKRQRQILDDWKAYEYDLCEYWKKEFNRKDPEAFFASYITTHTRNLEAAEKRLKRASSSGNIIEITHLQLAADLQAVTTPVNSLRPIEDKLRIRRNLARLDIFERIGVWVEVNTYKLTIMDMQQASEKDRLYDLAAKLIVPIHRPVVLLSLTNPVHSANYTLAIS
nr:hypothetical protein [Brucella anthropi]